MAPPTKQPAAKPATPARPFLQRLRRWLLWSLLFLAVVPPLQALLLRFVDPPLTGTMVSVAIGHGWESGDWRWPEQSWRSLDQLPRHALIAAISSEDRQFLEHDGFDLWAIRQAFERLQRAKPGGKLIGGSTISQQVARNVFLWQHRSWPRKALEAWYTVWLEVFCSKERILEVYLNVAEMGPMVFGMEAAARHWYGKPAMSLQPTESASIIGLLPAPKRWTPSSGPVRRRVAWVRNAPAWLPPTFAPQSKRVSSAK